MIELTIGPRVATIEGQTWTCDDDEQLGNAIQARSDVLYRTRGRYLRDVEIWLAVAIASEYGATKIDISKHETIESRPGVVY